MKKIKVLQFPIGNARGGITQYALQNWKFINRSRFQFDFATRSKKLDFEDELVKDGCRVHYLSCSSEENEKQFILEVEKILDEGYDVVHLHTSYWKGFLVEQLAMKRNVPIVIIHAHSTMIDTYNNNEREKSLNIHNQLKDKIKITDATHFRACSKLAGEWLFGKNILKNSITVLNNAIEIDRFIFDINVRKKYRKKLGLDNKFVLGHVGRFVYQKNHSFLIEIFNKVYKINNNVKLLLIGDGPLQPTIMKKVNEYGLEKNVMFMGKRDDVNCLLQAMDVFLLPSRFEGLPIVLVESQTSGLKSFASDMITDESIITEDLTLLSNDIDIWVERIAKVMNGYERKNRKKEIIGKGYSLEHQIKRIERLYSGEIQ